MGLGFRGVSANHEDQVALNIAVNLLNNANGNNGLSGTKPMGNMFSMELLREHESSGKSWAVAIMPKSLIESYSSAEEDCLGRDQTE